jgi:hypothetical protein
MIAKNTVVENIDSLAKMTSDEKDLFCNGLVDRYPNLAEELMTHFGFLLQDKDLTQEDQTFYKGG